MSATASPLHINHSKSQWDRSAPAVPEMVKKVLLHLPAQLQVGSGVPCGIPLQDGLRGLPASHATAFDLARHFMTYPVQSIFQQQHRTKECALGCYLISSIVM